MAIQQILLIKIFYLYKMKIATHPIITTSIVFPVYAVFDCAFSIGNIL